MDKIIHLESVDSTSKYIKNHLNEFDNFDVVIADYQTNGKGRGNHFWCSNKNENLLFSFLLKDEFWIKNYSLLSIAIGVAISSALTKLKLINVSLKWPNDVYVNNKKICGILLEGKLPEYIIVGIGLNINQTSFNIDNATSLKLDTKTDYVVQEIFNLVFSRIKEIIELKNLEKIVNDFNDRNYLKNKIISFNYQGSLTEGIALNIDKNGCLIIRKDNIKIKVDSDEVNEIK